MSTDRSVLIRVGFVLVLAVIFAAPSLAEAGFTLVTSESAFGANDSVNWDSLGTLTTADFSITSTDGTQVSGHLRGGGRQDEPVIIERSFSVSLVQLNGSIFIKGEDTSAQQVENFVSITFDFPKPVSGFGAAVDMETNEGAVFGSITVMDTSERPLTFNVTNNSGGGTAFSGFLGIRSDTANLSSLTYYDEGGGFLVSGTVLGIGTAALDSPTVSSVPVPSTLTLAGVGIASLLGASWRRRKRTAE